MRLDIRRNKKMIFVIVSLVFLFLFTTSRVALSASFGTGSHQSEDPTSQSQTKSTPTPQDNGTKFCICTFDKSNCDTSIYNVEQECVVGINSKTDGPTKFECVPLAQVDSSQGCDSLVSATQSTDAGNDEGSKNGVVGNSNSDLLNNLRPQIEGLNKLPVKDVQGLIGRIINVLLGILGSLALAMIMYGGILFMISGGNADKRKKSIGILVWAVLGIVIIFSSYTVINFVFDIFR